MARQKRLVPSPGEIFPNWPNSHLEKALAKHVFDAASLACEISFQIKHHRSKAGWSQSQLAKKAHISEFTVFNIENGKSWADLYTVGVLFSALGIKPQDLGQKTGHTSK